MLEVVAIRLDAFDARCGERFGEFRDGRFARVGVDHELCDQRIVKGRYLCARLDPVVAARAIGKANLGQQAGAGLEILAGIFRVDADLDGVAARLGRDERGRLTGCDAQHPFDEIEARDHLGDAVLDLQPRVHLQEIECASLHIIDKLDRARGAIADCLAEPHRGGAERAALLLAQAGCGRFLDHLLVPPLRGAVAFAERDHVPQPVAEKLDLDVARDLDEFLQIDAVVLEVVAPETAHRLKFIPQLLRRAAELHSDAAAARRALQHHRQPDARRFRDSLIRARQQSRAGEQRHAAITRDFP